jgi:hypothetical protein
VTRQAIREHAPADRPLSVWMKDPRNLVWVGVDCHASHHAASKRFQLTYLPDSVFEFARDLMGAGPASVWLARHYAGTDPRLDALIGSGAYRVWE